MSNANPHNWTATQPAEDVLRDLQVDWWAPLWPGANVLRATDGRCYVHEYGRWCVDSVVREVPSFTVDFPLLQDWPDPVSNNQRPTTASGEIQGR